MSTYLADPILWTCAVGLVAAAWAWWPAFRDMTGLVCEDGERREMRVVLLLAWTLLGAGLYGVWRGLGWLVTQ